MTAPQVGPWVRPVVRDPRASLAAFLFPLCLWTLWGEGALITVTLQHGKCISAFTPCVQVIFAPLDHPAGCAARAYLRAAAVMLFLVPRFEAWNYLRLQLPFDCSVDAPTLVVATWETSAQFILHLTLCSYTLIITALLY